MTSQTTSGSTETYTISELELNTTESISKNVYIVFQLGKDKAQTAAQSASDNTWGTETWSLTSDDLDLEAVVYEKHTLRPDAVVGYGTHHITHGHKQGKLVIQLQSKKGNNEVGSVAFYMRSNRDTSSRGSGATTGAATGAGAAGIGVSSGTGTGTGQGPVSRAKEAVTGNSGSSRDTSGVSRGTGSTEGVTAGVGGMSLGSEGGRNFETSSSQKAGLQSITGAAEQPVCDQKYYTKIEDRPEVREVVTTIREHHPIEKEFVTETRPTGREQERSNERSQEVVGSNTRVVDVKERDPCAGVPTSGTGNFEGGQTGTGYTGTNTGAQRGVGNTAGQAINDSVSGPVSSVDQGGSRGTGTHTTTGHTGPTGSSRR
eukprot:jgi/Astpho2/3735/Aster-04919